MNRTNEQAAAFHVGDRVKFPLVTQTVRGVIVEDRGPLGVGGRRLYRVEVPLDPDEPMFYTMPENDLRPDEDWETRRTALTKEKVIRYLKGGGLISILQRNTSGGKHQPRVWLSLDQLGNVTYTFDADRGIIGGETVPFWTLHENSKILKAEKVLQFLATFGLNRQEAEEVVRAVGTAP